MVPPTAVPKACSDCKHLVFVPVSGQLVFCVCVLLAVAIFFLWFLPLCIKGVQFEES